MPRWGNITPRHKGEVMKTFDVTIKVRITTDIIDIADVDKSADLLVDDILIGVQEWKDFTIEKVEWNHIGEV